MHTLIIISFLLLQCQAQVFTYEWNVLGTGFDVLENKFRESYFVLTSHDRSDPDKQILTKTLPDGVIMIKTPTNIFHM